MQSNSTDNQIDEILAGLYGLGIGLTAKKVLERADPDSVVAQEIAEAKAKLKTLLAQAFNYARIHRWLDAQATQPSEKGGQRG